MGSATQHASTYLLHMHTPLMWGACMWPKMPRFDVQCLVCSMYSVLALCAPSLHSSSCHHTSRLSEVNHSSLHVFVALVSSLQSVLRNIERQIQDFQRQQQQRDLQTELEHHSKLPVDIQIGDQVRGRPVPMCSLACQRPRCRAALLHLDQGICCSCCCQSAGRDSLSVTNLSLCCIAGIRGHATGDALSLLVCTAGAAGPGTAAHGEAIADSATGGVAAVLPPAKQQCGIYLASTSESTDRNPFLGRIVCRLLQGCMPQTVRLKPLFVNLFVTWPCDAEEVLQQSSKHPAIGSRGQQQWESQQQPADGSPRAGLHDTLSGAQQHTPYNTSSSSSSRRCRGIAHQPSAHVSKPCRCYHAAGFSLCRCVHQPRADRGRGDGNSRIGSSKSAWQQLH